MPLFLLTVCTELTRWHLYPKVVLRCHVVSGHFYHLVCFLMWVYKLELVWPSAYVVAVPQPHTVIADVANTHTAI